MNNTCFCFFPHASYRASHCIPRRAQGKQKPLQKSLQCNLMLLSRVWFVTHPVKLLGLVCHVFFYIKSAVLLSSSISFEWGFVLSVRLFTKGIMLEVVDLLTTFLFFRHSGKILVALFICWLFLWCWPFFSEAFCLWLFVPHYIPLGHWTNGSMDRTPLQWTLITQRIWVPLLSHRVVFSTLNGFISPLFFL